jgi:hypothetical protein
MWSITTTSRQPPPGAVGVQAALDVDAYLQDVEAESERAPAPADD